MAVDRWQRIQELFEQAAALPMEERPSFLAKACGGDAELRAEVESLLEHDALAGDGFLEQPAFLRPTPAGDRPPEETPTTPQSGGPARSPPVRSPLPRTAPTIEGYEILRELNRGGQGVVYQALQKTTKRKVAIKVLLEGPYASPSAQKRFEREIELVAQLKHPNIITVYHSGTTPDGRPFYVMDYVRGVPLHQYVRDKKLALEETLNLFSTVCAGVQYAHQKGVIHRDLKPGNILVDVEGVPKIMDFGLAKVVTGSIDTVVSMTQQVVGTLPYMSPEQARGNPDEIDTRTDVYALGVILYELLTGHYPYPVVGQIAEVLRHITETPPTPPSRQWKPDSGVTQRKSGKSRIGHCPIDDEVQTIVLHALSKERERRYQSAGQLAQDIGHYLANEPIEARRDSGWYVLKKQLRRYKVPVVLAAAFVVVITAGFGTSVSYWRQAVQERDRADQKADEADEQRTLADTRRELADQRYEEIIRLADLKRLADARTAAESLWFTEPGKVREMRAWLSEQALPLRDRLPRHEMALRKLRERAIQGVTNGCPTWEFPDAETQWQHDALVQLVEGLQAFVDPDPKIGTLAAVQERLAFAESILDPDFPDDTCGGV